MSQILKDNLVPFLPNDRVMDKNIQIKKVILWNNTIHILNMLPP